MPTYIVEHKSSANQSTVKVIIKAKDKKDARNKTSRHNHKHISTTKVGKKPIEVGFSITNPQSDTIQA